jgi:hypothetical protein
MINQPAFVATRLCLSGWAVGGGAAAERGLLGTSGSIGKEQAPAIKFFSLVMVFAEYDLISPGLTLT